MGHCDCVWTFVGSATSWCEIAVDLEISKPPLRDSELAVLHTDGSGRWLSPDTHRRKGQVQSDLHNADVQVYKLNRAGMT